VGQLVFYPALLSPVVQQAALAQVAIESIGFLIGFSIKKKSHRWSGLPPRYNSHILKLNFY